MTHFSSPREEEAGDAEGVQHGKHQREGQGDHHQADGLLQAQQALVDKTEERGQAQDHGDGLKKLHEAAPSCPATLDRAHHWRALGSGGTGSSFSLSWLPVITRTDAVVPTRSSTPSGTSTR